MDIRTGPAGADNPSSFFSGDDFEAYGRDGFVAVPQMYDAAEMRRLTGWIEEFAGREPVFGEQMVYLEDSLAEEGGRVLSRIEKFLDYHQQLQDFVYGERMIGRVTELLGEEPILFKEKINFKLPGGGGFEPHQDIQPGWDEYASFFISVLVTVDPSTFENGCLELAAGHHKRGLLGEKWKPLTPGQLEGVEFEKFPTEPGEVVFFDCFVPHQSAPNPTDSPRRNLYLTFNRSSEGDHRQQYYADKRASFPPDNEREPDREYKFRV
ncbi:MAG: phytanoyl-CoA dioxygenase family protein [Planctomycetota bacterium]|jgi:hypothetical protein|nr:phytanoyl-CoA dioxygenase family protein [Planctomycetota bacterium]